MSTPVTLLPVSREQPAERIVAVTPADTDMATGPCRALLVGVAGLANLMDFDGNTITGVPLQAGYNPISVRQVRTGTVASQIFALY
jgi:hypothetical protein